MERLTSLVAMLPVSTGDWLGLARCYKHRALPVWWYIFPSSFARRGCAIAICQSHTLTSLDIIGEEKAISKRKKTKSEYLVFSNTQPKTQPGRLRSTLVSCCLPLRHTGPTLSLR